METFPLLCCVGDCTAKECGTDGCWGECGECGANELCSEGSCECIPDSATCGEMCCSLGQVCFENACCEGDCDGKECGDDGCGVKCGECDDKLDCTNDSCEMDGQCSAEIDDSSCLIDDSCIGSGEEKPGNECQKCLPLIDKHSWSNQKDGYYCGKNSECQNGNCECVDQQCGGTCCEGGDVCDSGACCTPACDGKECGDNGCGDVCGVCPEGHMCEEGLCTSLWWKDPETGLTWQNPPADTIMNWNTADTYCKDLDFAGHSDWFLPTIDELRSFVRGCPSQEPGGACNVQTGGCLSMSCYESCVSCPSLLGPGVDGCYWPKEAMGTCGSYWSSNIDSDAGGYAIFLNFDGAWLFNHQLGEKVIVRCVRE